MGLSLHNAKNICKMGVGGGEGGSLTTGAFQNFHQFESSYISN